MKNKFFNIITALLLTLAIVSPSALAVNTTISEFEISTCTSDPGDDVLDVVSEPNPLIP